MSATTTTRRRPRSPPLMYNMGMGNMMESGNAKAPRPLIKLEKRKEKEKSPQQPSPQTRSPSLPGSRPRTMSGVSSGSGGNRSHGGSSAAATTTPVASVVSSVFRSLRRHASSSQSSMRSQASDTVPVSPASDNLEAIPEASTSSHKHNNKASRMLGTDPGPPRTRPNYPASLASSIEPMEFASPPTPPPPQRKPLSHKPVPDYLQSENTTRQLRTSHSTAFDSLPSPLSPPVVLSRPPKGHRRPKTAPSSESSGGSGDYGFLRRALPADVPQTSTSTSTRLSHRSRPSTSSSLSLSFAPLHFFQSKRGEPETLEPARRESIDDDFTCRRPRAQHTDDSLSSQSDDNGVAEEESDIMIISRHHMPIEPPSPLVPEERKEISASNHHTLPPLQPLVLSFPYSDKQALADPPPFQFTLVQSDEEDERKEKPAEEFVLMSQPSTTRRREAVWSGEWNQRDMQDVISKLRNLR